jgi:glycolate oxidase iron-sulfur subunit
MHLVDHGRRRIEETYTRPPAERLLRWLLATILPFPSRFRWTLRLAQLTRPLAALLPGRLKPLMRLAPRRVGQAASVDRPQVFAAEGQRLLRVGLLSGCAQQVLKPEINAATVRLLTRHGVEVVVAEGAGCCGALTHHLGRERAALGSARANIAAWWREIEGAGLDAIIANASGCGTMLKDYGFMLRQDRAWAAKAARVSALARDVTEVLADIELMAAGVPKLRVAYHSACSMQHGQQLHQPPRALLAAAGFEVAEIAEGHLCCGSAGTYNILQPEFAEPLRMRKTGNIRATGASVVATGNIGCIQQLEAGLDLPILHTVELLDWATGGPKPPALSHI